MDTLPGRAVDRASALVRSLGSVDRASGRVMIGCDDLYSLQFFGENLRGYWNRKGDRTIEQLFVQADAEYPALEERCRAFDARLMADARRSGGPEYAELCALAYRQAIAAHKLLEGPDGELLFVSKENFSNGCAATVDVPEIRAEIPLAFEMRMEEITAVNETFIEVYNLLQEAFAEGKEEPESPSPEK